MKKKEILQDATPCQPFFPLAHPRTRHKEREINVPKYIHFVNPIKPSRGKRW